MPDSNVIWKAMHNYEPFLTEDSDDCIFTVRWLDILPDLSLKRLMIENNEDESFPRYEFYELNDKWLLAAASNKYNPVCLYLLTDKKFTEAGFYCTDNWSLSINTVLMMMFAHATAQKDTLLIHSSVTLYDGKGYLFLGKSGTGKSTHSQLWINNIAGCQLLNDDNPVIRIEDDGTVRVYGTPWSGKTPCYRNLSAPIGAIVDLHQAKENVIKRLSLPQAYGAMLKSYSGFRFLKEKADGYHATNEKLLCKVPFYSLDCLPDAEAAWLCHNTVTQR